MGFEELPGWQTKEPPALSGPCPGHLFHLAAPSYNLVTDVWLRAVNASSKLREPKKGGRGNLPFVAGLSEAQVAGRAS